MKLTVKKRLVHWTLLDEDENIVAKIRNRRIIGPDKMISLPDGTVKYTTGITKSGESDHQEKHKGYKNYVIYENGKPLVTANIKFIPNPAKHKNRSCSLLPRDIESMELDTPYGKWAIQSPDSKNINIIDADRHLGTIECSPALKPNSLICHEKLPAVFWAGIYTLVHYMRCEGFIIIV